MEWLNCLVKSWAKFDYTERDWCCSSVHISLQFLFEKTMPRSSHLQEESFPNFTERLRSILEDFQLWRKYDVEQRSETWWSAQDWFSMFSDTFKISSQIKLYSRENWKFFHPHYLIFRSLKIGLSYKLALWSKTWIFSSINYGDLWIRTNFILPYHNM